ncbi:hypothetical protein Tco_1454847 [Tanacetum coccineum]
MISLPRVTTSVVPHGVGTVPSPSPEPSPDHRSTATVNGGSDGQRWRWWRGWGGDDGDVVMKVGMAAADGGVVTAAAVAVDNGDGGDGCGGVGGVEVVLLWRWLPWR